MSIHVDFIQLFLPIIPAQLDFFLALFNINLTVNSIGLVTALRGGKQMAAQFERFSDPSYLEHIQWDPEKSIADHKQAQDDVCIFDIPSSRNMTVN